MSTQFHLTGKMILVTGASSGIGRQVAISVAEMGATLVLNGRNEARLTETLNELSGDGHVVLAANLLNEIERKTMVEQLPQLDGIVHCAGVVNSYPIKFLNEDKIAETLKINYDAPVLLMALITRKKKLNRNASIVFLSSISGQIPHVGGAMYAGSKAALESFSKVFAMEFYRQGIRSNCLSPAMVKTPMYAEAEEAMSKESMDEHVAKYPLGVGRPEDVANAAIFFLSDASRWITGTNLRLDGGLAAGM
jgi:NAD(P)-dependent dehydrogenase (short-subunit alcohol dehydrogenase family)